MRFFLNNLLFFLHIK